MDYETHAKVSPMAFEIRAELLTTRATGTSVRIGEQDHIHIGSVGMLDYVRGGENTRVSGEYSESFSTLTERSNQLDIQVDGKLSTYLTTDNLILGGVFTQTQIGATLITSGMSDAMMAGGSVRITVPSDIWLAGLIGLEEKIGTAYADGALVEISVTHFEREYLTALYAIGAYTRTGMVHTTTKTSALALLSVSTHIRSLTSGAGGASGAEGGDQTPNIVARYETGPPTDATDSPTQPSMLNSDKPAYETELMIQQRQLAEYQEIVIKAKSRPPAYGLLDAKSIQIAKEDNIRKIQRAEVAVDIAQAALDLLVSDLQASAAVSAQNLESSNDLVSTLASVTTSVTGPDGVHQVLDAEIVNDIQLGLDAAKTAEDLAEGDALFTLDTLRQLEAGEDVDSIGIGVQIDELDTTAQVDALDDLSDTAMRGDLADEPPLKGILKEPDSGVGHQRRVQWGADTSATIPNRFDALPQAPETNIPDDFNFNKSYDPIKQNVDYVTPNRNWDSADWASYNIHKDTLNELDNSARKRVGKRLFEEDVREILQPKGATEDTLIKNHMNVGDVRTYLVELKHEARTTTEIGSRAAARVFRAASEGIDYIDEIGSRLFTQNKILTDLLESGDILPLTTKVNQDDLLEVLGIFEEALSGASTYGDPFTHARQSDLYQFQAGLAASAIEEVQDIVVKGGNPLPVIDERISYVRNFVSDPTQLRDNLNTLQEVRSQIINALTSLEVDDGIIMPLQGGDGIEIVHSPLKAQESSWRRWTDYTKLSEAAEELATGGDEVQDAVQALGKAATGSDEIVQIDDGIDLTANLAASLDRASTTNDPGSLTTSVGGEIEDIARATDPPGASSGLDDIPEPGLNLSADGESLLDDDSGLLVRELDIESQQIDLSDIAQLPPQPKEPPVLIHTHKKPVLDLSTNRNYVFPSDIDGSDFITPRDGSAIVYDKTHVDIELQRRISQLRGIEEYIDFDEAALSQRLHDLALFEYAKEANALFDNPVDVLTAIDSRLDALVQDGGSRLQQELTRTQIFLDLHGHLSRPSYAPLVAPTVSTIALVTEASSSFYETSGTGSISSILTGSISSNSADSISYLERSVGISQDIDPGIRFSVKRIPRAHAWYYRIKQAIVTFDTYLYETDIDFDREELSEAVPAPFPFGIRPTRLLVTREELVSRIQEAQNTYPEPSIDFFGAQYSGDN